MWLVLVAEATYCWHISLAPRSLVGGLAAGTAMTQAAGKAQVVSGKGSF